MSLLETLPRQCAGARMAGYFTPEVGYKSKSEKKNLTAYP